MRAQTRKKLWVLGVTAAAGLIATTWLREHDVHAPSPTAGPEVPERLSGGPSTSPDAIRAKRGSSSSQSLAASGVDQGHESNREADGSPALQGALGAVARADADKADEPVWYALPVLSPEWLRSYIVVCGDTAFGNCASIRSLAVRIATDQKGPSDSWPHRLEYELKEYLAAVAPANAIEASHARCSRIGCLAYVEGTQHVIFGSDFPEGSTFWRELNRQPWIEEFQLLKNVHDGSLSDERGLRIWSNQRRWGLLMVFARDQSSP